MVEYKSAPAVAADLAFTQLAKEYLPRRCHMIRLLLKRRGYSPRDIIHLAGISESTYRKLSRNEPIRMDVLERVCAALRVDVRDVCSVLHN